ncbi:MAG: metal-dependent hydrolase [Nitrospinae bacterium]|nr:metal-dependent hydrolase [Nitrospinota bacterium]
MNPVTHVLLSWLVANTAPLTRRERVVVTVAGAIPDFDGLGFIAEQLTAGQEGALTWYSDYHHVLGHNLSFGLLVVGMSWLVCRRRWTPAALSVVSFHLHLLGDLISGRGPDGYQWPVPYLFPFSDIWQWTWSGQWALNAWPNFVVTGVALLATLYLAVQRGYSPLEIISAAADRRFVATLRSRFAPRRAVP